MTTVVSLHTEVAHRYVIELRYEQGQIYWDRAGRIAREISSMDGWDVEAIDVNACRLRFEEKNLVFNFGPGKLDLSQTQTDKVSELLPVDEFGALAEQLSKIVIKQLDVSFYPRIGFRFWDLYPTANRTESEKLSQNLMLFSINESMQKKLGTISEAAFRLIVERKRHMVRIAIAPFEQPISLPESIVMAARARARDHWKDQRHVMIDKMKAEKIVHHYPQFGLLLDMDAYIEEPPYPDELSISDFVTTAAQDFKELKPLVLSSRA